MMRNKFYQIFFTDMLEYIELLKEANLYEQYLSIIYFYSTEKLLNDKEKIEGCECPICLNEKRSDKGSEEGSEKGSEE